MRLINQFLLIALLTAFGATPVFAGVLLDFTPISGWDPAQAGQLPPLEAGWSAYLMSARSDDNSLISAVDVQLRGNFAQRWGVDEENPLGISTPTGLSRTGFDSHLLPANDALLISSTVHEDLGNSPLTMPSGARVGSGNSLRGVWGIPSATQRSALDLAYVVIPSGSLDQLDYAVDIATRDSVFNLRKGFDPPHLTPTPEVVVVGEAISSHAQPYSQPVLDPNAADQTRLNLTRLDSIDSASQLLSITQPGWAGYLLSATTLDGAKFSAVDIKLQGNFHQYWGFSEDAGEALATVQGASRSGVDTHLLPATDAILLSDQFDEDLGSERNATVGGSAYGVGNSIKGVWGIPGGSQSQSLDLAYIVAPEGLTLDQLQYSVDLARNDGGTAYLRNGFAAPEAPPLPPPTVVQEGTTTTLPGYNPHGELPALPPELPVTVVPPTLPPVDQPTPPPLQPTLPPVDPTATTELSLTRLDSLNSATQPLSITQAGWAGYLLSATSLNGAKFSAVDLKLQGVFHQYWGFSEDAGEALATVQGASRSGVDTHLLPAADAIPITNQFAEDLGPERNTTAGGSVYGVGNAIQGVWGIPGASQTETLDLAYIVAPEGFSLDQLQYSIDLARTEGGVVNFRNGFAMPEPPMVTPPDMYTVTGQPQPQTPGTALETVVREDGSVVREEVPIPGWQPGDPWGSLPINPPAEVGTTPTLIELPPPATEQQLPIFTDFVVADDGSILALYQELTSIDRIRTEVVNNVPLLYLDDQLVGRKLGLRIGAGDRLLTNVGDNSATDDPSETVVITTQESALERLVRTAIRGEQSFDNGELALNQFATMYLQSLPNDLYIHGTNWAMDNTGMADWFGDVVGVAYDADSSYAYTMLSDRGPSFEAVPEPSAIVITLAGIALLFRPRKN